MLDDLPGNLPDVPGGERYDRVPLRLAPSTPCLFRGSVLLPIRGHAPVMVLEGARRDAAVTTPQFVHAHEQQGRIRD